MYLKNISIKNILSYGERPVTYQLDKNQLTLLTAKNGEGKCVDKSTKINIKFLNDTTKHKYSNSLDSNIICSTIGEITEFYKEYPECVGLIEVETRHGYYKILAAEITAPNSEYYNVTTSSGKNIICSPNHRFISNGEWVHCENLNVNDTILTTEGNETISSLIKSNDTRDLYDIEVDVVHEYYSNDIVSHNSSVIEGITFALFGKPFRDIKKDQLINITNKKNGLVECNLIGNNGYDVKIIRGLKPNVFEIYENGKLVNQNSSASEYQNYLETEILGMNFVTFSQTVVISKTKYIPFMRLKTGDRRTFVESILNLEVLGEMYKQQTKNVSNLKKEISNFEVDIKLIKSDLNNKSESISRLKKLVKSIESESKIKNQSEISELKDKINDLKDLSATLKDQLSQNPHTDKLSKMSDIQSAKIKLEADLSLLNHFLNKISVIKDKCHECGQCIEFDHDMHNKKINDVKAKIDSKNKLLKSFSDKLKSLSEINILSNDFNNKQNDLKNKINNINKEINIYNSQILKLKNTTFDTTEYDKQLLTLNEEYSGIDIKLKSMLEKYEIELSELDDHLLTLDLLKDSGIKSSIIQNSIPLINKFVNKYLQQFGFFIGFELDSEFNEKILVKGVQHALDYGSFSEGEKLRIDLALILAWRHISLLLSGTTCNLMFFDEITDASMDQEGVELFARAITTLDKSNVWIISHTPEKLESYARGYIRLNKIDGFTSIIENK